MDLINNIYEDLFSWIINSTGGKLDKEEIKEITSIMGRLKHMRVPIWQPIETAPKDTLIRIKLHNWEGTGIYYPGEDWEDDPNPHCSILHYNGQVLVPVFYATHWKPIEEQNDK